MCIFNDDDKHAGYVLDSLPKQASCGDQILASSYSKQTRYDRTLEKCYDLLSGKNAMIAILDEQKDRKIIVMMILKASVYAATLRATGCRNQS